MLFLKRKPFPASLERMGKKMESGRFFRGYTHEEMFRMTTIFLEETFPALS
jgi:hypothetical protein